ncbi:MAG: cytochrome b [Proteobacteria bacterium]|nr:cytochrome b [Pseudomonadota bacterium]
MIDRQQTPVQAATGVYDRTTVWLHWTTAALVAILWCLGQTIDWFARGEPRVAARSVHILCGVALAVLLLYRIRWRAMAGRRLPPAGSGLWQRAARIVHGSLYVLLCSTVLLGIANAWIRGDSIFGLFRIPALVAAHSLKSQVEDLHSWSANLLVIVAVLHIVAGVAHHFIYRDGVLRRMVTAASDPRS